MAGNSLSIADKIPMSVCLVLLVYVLKNVVVDFGEEVSNYSREQSEQFLHNARPVLGTELS